MGTPIQTNGACKNLNLTTTGRLSFPRGIIPSPDSMSHHRFNICPLTSSGEMDPCTMTVEESTTMPQMEFQGLPDVVSPFHPSHIMNLGKTSGLTSGPFTTWVMVWQNNFT